METLNQYFASSFSLEELAIIAAIAVATLAVAALIRGWGSRVVLLISGLVLIIFSSSTLRVLPVLVLALLITRYEESKEPAEAAVRYRFVVEMVVDGQVVEGSAVQEVEYLHYPTSRENTVQIKTRIEGNALFIPLPNRQRLMILMRLALNKHTEYTTFFATACDIRRIGFQSIRDVLTRIGDFSGRCAVNERDLPMMILIPDMSSQPVFREVRNLGGPDNPIIPGVFFKSAYVETTTLPLSSGIEADYPWMPTAKYIGRDQFGRSDWLGDNKGSSRGFEEGVDEALGF